MRLWPTRRGVSLPMRFVDKCDDSDRETATSRFSHNNVPLSRPAEGSPPLNFPPATLPAPPTASPVHSHFEPVPRRVTAAFTPFPRPTGCGGARLTPRAGGRSASRLSDTPDAARISPPGRPPSRLGATEVDDPRRMSTRWIVDWLHRLFGRFGPASCNSRRAHGGVGVCATQGLWERRRAPSRLSHHDGGFGVVMHHCGEPGGAPWMGRWWLGSHPMAADGEPCG